MNKGIQRGFSGIKDQDREILLNIENDKDLLKACSVNKYVNEKVCDDIFFRNRLSRTYPDTLKYKPKYMNWKDYLLRVIYYIAKMKEDYNYNYEEGNPKVQYEIFKETRNDDIRLLATASKRGELLLVKEGLKRENLPEEYWGSALRLASDNGHLEVARY